jgi:hypothetical protein
MSEIPWRSLDPRTVENLLSMLLNHLYPTAQRINGSGGDDGRDVQLRLDGHLHVFEIKSFAAHLGTSQKAQIRRSLQRAAALSPADWTLLVPIDFTPSALRWFEDTLASLVPFPIHLLGKTRLETELAQRPFIQRYYLEDAHREVERLVTLYRAERAALVGGVADAIERVKHIANQLNEIDPHYRFEIRTDGVATTVSAIPRYDRALQDRPIEVSVGLRFPDTAEGRQVAREFESHIDYGTPATIPGEFIERFESNMPAVFGTAAKPARIEISPRPPSRTLVLFLRLKSPDDRLLAELALRMSPTSSGRKGAMLEGQDRTGCLTVSMVYAPGESGSFSARFHPDRPYGAFEMRALARFLAALVPPNHLSLADADGQEFARASGFQSELSEEAPAFAALMEDVILIQWAAAMTRDVGPVFAPRDLRAIEVASALLRGEEVATTWDSLTLELTDDASEEARQLLAREGVPLFAVVAKPHVARIGGVGYPIGRGVEYKLASFTLAPEHDDWRANGIPPGVDVRLVPGDDATMQMRLASEEQLLGLGPQALASVSDGTNDEELSAL